MSTSTQTSPALASLVTWLTRPLLLQFPSNIVSNLCQALEANLSSLFPSSKPGPSFTFVLSTTSLPPTPIYSACLAVGLAWADWVRVFGGQDLYFFVSPKSIQIGLCAVFSENASTLTIWTQDIEDATEVPSIARMKTNAAASPPSSRTLQDTLDSARARRSFLAAKNVTQTTSIKLPTLFASRPAPDMIIDIDSDSDSDSASTTSTRFSFKTSSDDSMTSVSSASSSPTSSSCELPATTFSRPAAKRTVAPRFAAPRRLVHDMDDAPIAPRLLSRSERRFTAALVDQTKKDVTKYLYQGGATNVITGGVMLGGAKPSPKPTRTRVFKKSAVLLGPDSDNWRV